MTDLNEKNFKQNTRGKQYKIKIDNKPTCQVNIQVKKMPFCTCILSDREREYRVGKKEESERERAVEYGYQISY